MDIQNKQGLFTSKDDDKQQKVRSDGAQIGLETFQRANSKRNDYQPQRRQQNEQSPCEPGISNTFRADAPRNKQSRLQTNSQHSISWIVVGGESGKGAREMHPDWPRGVRDQCIAANVPFFMKQMGGHPNKRAKLEDIPKDLRIRELP